MSCACENKKLASDLDRIRRLAKALAIAEGKTVGIYINADGTYGFGTIDVVDNPITEYISAD